MSDSNLIPGSIPDLSNKSWSVEQNEGQKLLIEATCVKMESVFHIDKTSLEEGDLLNSNVDKTLEFLHFRNEWNTIMSISQIDEAMYAQFLAIESGRLAITNILELRNKLAIEWYEEGMSKTLRVSVIDTSKTGLSIYSINISLPKDEPILILPIADPVFGISRAQEHGFISGVTPFEIIKEVQEKWLIGDKLFVTGELPIKGNLGKTGKVTIDITSEGLLAWWKIPRSDGKN